MSNVYFRFSADYWQCPTGLYKIAILGRYSFLMWCLQALDHLDDLEHPPIPKIIGTNPPFYGGSLEEVQD
jgi:hypothetical protein